MSVRIKEETCVGCGRCIESCPGNLLSKNEKGKAEIRHPEDCWGCTSCLKECPAGAILYFLGADAGGRGSTLGFRKESGGVFWTVTHPDGKQQTIRINPADANKY